MAEETGRIRTALNRTAAKAVSEIRSDLPRRFAMRNQWTKKGLRTDLASGEELEARVYSVDPYMVKQEEGQTWKPDGHVAIPKGARPSARSLISRSMFPKALRGRKDVFAFDFSKNSSWKPYPHNGIFQRLRGGKHLRFLYLLKDKKTTPARWQFSEQVEDVVDQYFDRYYDAYELDRPLGP
jgi:hypothetical protein